MTCAGVHDGAVDDRFRRRAASERHSSEVQNPLPLPSLLEAPQPLPQLEPMSSPTRFSTLGQEHRGSLRFGLNPVGSGPLDRVLGGLSHFNRVKPGYNRVSPIYARPLPVIIFCKAANAQRCPRSIIGLSGYPRNTGSEYTCRAAKGNSAGNRCRSLDPSPEPPYSSDSTGQNGGIGSPPGRRVAMARIRVTSAEKGPRFSAINVSHANNVTNRVSGTRTSSECG